MKYKLIGRAWGHNKQKRTFSYTRECKICGSIYKTEDKYSANCPDCRSSKSIKKICPICGKEKQFGDKKEVCVSCRAVKRGSRRVFMALLEK